MGNQALVAKRVRRKDIPQKHIHGMERYEDSYNDDMTSDRINRAPGLGGRGLDPRNPWVVAVRGHGDRGGGENRPVKFNRSIDIRGETPAVINRLGSQQPLQMLYNERLSSSRQGQLEHTLLRAPRRIQV
jgi:hypothetical protein